LVSEPYRLRAPQENGAVVAVPSLAEAKQLLAANRQQLAHGELAGLGRPWAELRRQARQVLVSAAREYLRSAGEPVPAWGEASVLMAGHQPELFHPGVWVKNFAVNGLAATSEATPINLVVDNDTAKSTALRLPVLGAGDSPWPSLTSVPFDHWTVEIPYEERAVRDEDLFASLPDHVAPVVKNWGFVPLLPAYWTEVRRQAQRTRLLGERLAAARRELERRWGCHNLELPVSLLCQTEPFAWFACHTLANLPRFHNIYNHCVHQYRLRYGIRSRNHPVPDLTWEDDWLEVPFWAWRAGEQQRQRLLARRRETAVELRAGKEPWPSLPVPPSGDLTEMVRAWQDLEQRGLKVRSRALTNTLFARLFVADLFIHGIGGGKYDELTDDIVRRYYQCEPPGYMVLSATLLLPFPAYPARAEDCRRLAREVRDLHYNPQRHLSNDAEAAPSVRDLAARKQAWTAREPANARERRERFQVLRELTAQLRAQVADRETALHQELTRCELELQGNAVLQRRDYAFCLYPESTLRPFCTCFLAR
jgi:hypothetical protein